MQTRKRWLASLMVLVMLLSVLPTQVMAWQTVSEPYDEVVYNLLDCEIRVTDDPSQEDADYTYLFEKDGSFTIPLEDDAFFPYEVQFQWNGKTTTEWFLTPDASVEVGGHTFYVQSETSSPASMQQIGMWVGETYIPAYPEAKTFTTESQVSSITMLPLEEKTFSLDLRGYLPNELRAVKLDTVVSSLTGYYGNTVEDTDGDVAAWAKWGYYTEEGEYISENDNYTIVNKDNTIDLSNYSKRSSTFDVEMIVGTADQLNADNLKYVVTVKTSTEIDSLFDFNVYSTDTPRRSISVSGGDLYTHEYYNDDLEDVNVYSLFVSALEWNEGQEVYLGLDFNAYKGALTYSVYNGYWETEEELKDENINSDILSASDTTGGYRCNCTYQPDGTDVPAITIVFKEGADIVQILPMYLDMYEVSQFDCGNIDFEIYNNEDPRKEIEIFSRTWDKNGILDENGNYHEEDGTGKSVYYLCVSKEAWKHGEQANLSMTLPWKNIQGLTQKVYEGYYESTVPDTATEITDRILGQNDMATTGGYLEDYSYKENYTGMPEITIVLKDGERTAFVLPMVLCMREVSLYFSNSGYLYQVSDNQDTSVSSKDFKIVKEKISNEVECFNIVLKNEAYPADAIYQLGLRLNPDGRSYGPNYVSKAVVGEYNTAEAIPADAVDIKDSLFDKGYAADYSNGVTFTVVDIYGDLHWVRIQTEVNIPEPEPEPEPDDGELPFPPWPASEDTYFRMNGAKWKDDTTEGSITAYKMPADADSYYYNGYQTVFLLKVETEGDTGNTTLSPIPSGTSILPVFYTGNKVEVYAGFDKTSGVKQESGVKDAVSVGAMSTIPEPIQYSAAAENKTHLKNYWVTFLTQYTGGAKLFVNAANDTGRMVEVKDDSGAVTETIPQREVLLTDKYENHHDVYFANIGDTDMEGLYVRLEDAQNIALDEYWTIQDTGVKKLAAFTTAKSAQFSSGAKIRLQPAKDENGEALKGDISGTLVIGYTGNGTTPVEEQRIRLTGTAGVPEIVTEEVVDGVKYVPYSALIQTNNMYDADAAKFTLVEEEFGGGALPPGLTLYPDGEIYGVPTTPGTYYFTVQLTYKDNEELSSFKEFEIEIQDNSDENVDGTNTDTQGYALIQRIPTNLYLDSLSADGELFISEGKYDEFLVEKRFFLDGQELKEGTDYTSESGSTKVTVQAQTFRNAGVGKHTISAEFRSGANNKTMKRTSQNVYVSKGSGSSGSGSGSGNSGNTKPSTNPTQPSYSITAAEMSNGSVQFSSNSAKAGDIVTVTVTPNQYYELLSLSIPGVALTKTGENTYTFVMPAGQVVVQAEFGEIQPDPESDLPFIDVRTTNWFYPGVLYAYQNGIMMGTSGKTFAPYQTLNRAMSAQIFYNMENRPKQVSLLDLGSVFFDLEADAWYTEAVNWVVSQDIMEGHENGQFSPMDPLTREQLTTVLFRYAAFKGYDTSARADLSQFTDKDSISSYALEAMSWANAMGIVLGTTDTTASPQGEANRAQTATVFQRFCENVENG